MYVCLVPEIWTKPKEDNLNVHIHLEDLVEKAGSDGAHGDYENQDEKGPAGEYRDRPPRKDCQTCVGKHCKFCSSQCIWSSHLCSQCVEDSDCDLGCPSCKGGVIPMPPKTGKRSTGGPSQNCQTCVEEHCRACSPLCLSDSNTCTRCLKDTDCTACRDCNVKTDSPPRKECQTCVGRHCKIPCASQCTWSS